MLNNLKIKKMSKSSGSSGVGLGTILFIVFLVLKLTNFIDWSWWWVTAPLWIPFSILFVLIVFSISILGWAGFWSRVFK